MVAGSVLPPVASHEGPDERRTTHPRPQVVDVSQGGSSRIASEQRQRMSLQIIRRGIAMLEDKCRVIVIVAALQRACGKSSGPTVAPWGQPAWRAHAEGTAGRMKV